MGSKILVYVLGVIIEQIKVEIPDVETAKEVIDDLLDTFEDKHPVLKAAATKFREQFDIPDDIGGDED